MAQYTVLDAFSIVTFVVTVAMECPLDILANTASVVAANRSNNITTYWNDSDFGVYYETLQVLGIIIEKPPDSCQRTILFQDECDDQDNMSALKKEIRNTKHATKKQKEHPPKKKACSIQNRTVVSR
eukprot:858790-Ditylum_brightwellii.AAC.1